MQEQSSIKNEINSRSIRHPRNVWIVRILAVFVILFSIDLDDEYVANNMPGRGSTWAKNWIALNELDLPYSPNKVEYSYFAEVAETAQNLAEKEIVKRAPSSVSSTNEKVFDRNNTVNDLEKFDRYEENIYLASLSQNMIISNFSEIDQVQARVKSEIDYQEELQLSLIHI